MGSIGSAGIPGMLQGSENPKRVLWILWGLWDSQGCCRIRGVLKGHYGYYRVCGTLRDVIGIIKP